MTKESTTYKLKPTLSQRIVQFVPDMEHSYPALASTSDHLNNNIKDDYHLIQVGEYGASTGLTVSFGFNFCDALILRDPKSDNLRAFAHITSGTSPDEYKEYVKNLSRFFDSPNLEAMVVSAGDVPVKLTKACQDSNVKIVQTVVVPMRDESHTYSHDIIVRPETTKVIINIDELGVKEINF